MTGDATSMSFGYVLAGQFLPSDDPRTRLQQTLQQVRVARQAGFTSIWATHHFLADFQYFQAIPLLARLAAEAEGMHLGTSVLLATLYHPVLLAEELATLDVICDGRLILGAGAAYRAKEFAAFGLPSKNRIQRMDQNLQLIRQLWSGQPVTYAAEHVKLDNAQLRLTPLQGDALPIWLGATGPKGVAHAARAGDEWLISPELALDAVLSRQEIYVANLPEGVAPESKRYPMMREAHVAPSNSAASAAQSALRTKYAAYARWGHAVDSFEALLESTFMLGDVDECVKQVQRYRERVGTEMIAIRMQWPGLDQRDVLGSLERFAEVIAATKQGRDE
jgi:alkanesulfonate monooxygenase SsuD/methylene tetrahydromethanopterin reductase-like flavin-dependent oxidoreductase (luciferase family)